jgi:probable F420-dependent oxidoreductase
LSARPFRFSLQARDAADRREWAELARRAEGQGCSLLVTPDHLDACLSPLAPLVIAAEATTTLRVGTLVLNNDFRHPALLAREAATVDLLTDGRFELGLGAGHAAPEYERAGLTFDPAGVRVARLGESVRVLRRLLDGQTVDFDGDHYRLRGETCHPRPVQAHVPLLVGGGGRRVLALAAREADAVGFTGLGRTLADGHAHETSGFSPAAVDRQVGWVQEQAGARLGGLELHVLVQGVVVTDRPRQAAEDLVATDLPGLSVDDVLATPYLLVGTAGGLADRLLEMRERWGFSHYTVRPDTLGASSPVIAALAGR